MLRACAPYDSTDLPYYTRELLGKHNQPPPDGAARVASYVACGNGGFGSACATITVAHC